jgi:hypothetical protein
MTGVPFSPEGIEIANDGYKPFRLGYIRVGGTFFETDAYTWRYIYHICETA